VSFVDNPHFIVSLRETVCSHISADGQPPGPLASRPLWSLGIFSDVGVIEVFYWLTVVQATLTTASLKASSQVQTLAVRKGPIADPFHDVITSAKNLLGPSPIGEKRGMCGHCPP